MFDGLSNYARGLGAAIMGQSGSMIPAAILDAVQAQIGNSGGVAVDVDVALAIPALNRALQFTSGVLSQLPLEVQKRGKDGSWVADTDDPFYNLLRYQPNAWTGADEWKQSTLNQMQLFGYSVTQIATAGGKPELRLGDNPRVFTVAKSRATQNSPFPEIVVRLDSANRTLSRKSYVLTRHVMTDGTIGRGILTDNEDVIGVAKATQNAFAAWLNNGFTAGGIASPKSAMNQNEYEMLRAALKDQRNEHSGSGASNAGSLWVPPYPLEIVPNTVNMTDAQMAESREFHVAEMGRLLGVPAHMMASEPTAPRANAVAGDLRFLTLTLKPLGNRLANSFHRQLLDANPAKRVAFDYSSLEMGDRLTEARIAQLEVTSGVSNSDELRAQRGKGTIEDGKGKKFFVPANTRPLDEKPAQAGLPKPAALTPPENNE